MKMLCLLTVTLMSLPLCAPSQGNLGFDNIFVIPGPAPVTISSDPLTFNPSDGPGGAYVGADYTASLYFLNGIVTNQAVFDSSNPILSAAFDTPFSGVTGVGPNHGPTVDGAGLFEGELNYGGYLGEATGQIVTIQVRAWYNGGGLYTSYDQALAADQNVGESNPVSLALALGASPPTPLEGLLPFTVGVVPEPSVFALLGLGSLLLFRRRKNA